jgi:REP element-mobilizing transposase RayT
LAVAPKGVTLVNQQEAGRRPQALPFTKRKPRVRVTHELGVSSNGVGARKASKYFGMPYKLRLEFPDAIYHVINRGNYRRWLFEDTGAKAAFEACLFSACKRSEWLLHAFVIMSNHFHLALETPRGNLVAGMQWLESTYANRFNRFRNERGHLFQGRYKALLVEPGETLGHVCTYIDLNPVRAGVVSVERLAEHRYSSFWYLRRPRQRPNELDLSGALAAIGGVSDDVAGWNCYQDYLLWQAAEGPTGKTAAYVSLSNGWALGSDGFKQALVLDHKLAAEARAWECSGAAEVREQRWQAALKVALASLPGALRQSRAKSAPWKVAIAAHLPYFPHIRKAISRHRLS